jgi:hypothetical protein
MTFFRIGIAFILAWLVAYTASVAFYTRQILAGYAELGLSIPFADAFSTFRDNFAGQLQSPDGPSWGIIVAVALAVAFLVAAGVKRIIRPLASVAYPVAGAAAIGGILALIESQFPGVGAIGGARTALGVALQMSAGLIGGVVFSIVANRGAR